MAKLRMQVVRCSGEDLDFPAIELNDISGSGRGYLTPKNCEYPQELVIQIREGMCRLTQVQLLSHQSHIASKIELFISASPDLQDNKFQRLGFLTLKSNVESNFMARELKTVHIDAEARYLRLLLHRCYVNERNLYNQVGIMAINVFGDALEEPSSPNELPNHSKASFSPLKPQSIHSTSNTSLNSNKPDMRFDPKTAAQIREIQHRKNEAVAVEDYDLAKRLKQQEEKLKSVGLQLARLEQQKKEAVIAEDYDAAKRIKSEILELEAGVYDDSPAPKMNDLRTSQESASSASNYSSKEVPPVHMNRVEYSSDPQEEEKAYEQDVNPHFAGLDDAEQLSDPDPLPPALISQSEDMMHVIGEYLTRCMYSNVWNHRDAALRKVALDIEEIPGDLQEVLEVGASLVEMGASDRIAQVTLAAFNLLDRLLHLSAAVDSSTLCGVLDGSFAQVVSRLGDQQTKVRDESAAILLRLASTPNIGLDCIVDHVLKRSKKTPSPKSLLGRLQMTQTFVEEFGPPTESDQPYSIENVMTFLEDYDCFGHQNKDVRDASKRLTVQLYRQVGPDIENYLTSLRPKQMEEYQTAFQSVNAPPKAPKPSPSTTALMPSDVQDESDNESVDEYTCPFCGIVDSSFASEELDKHFWAHCKMLTPCRMCGQVIEISSLTDHLLTECARKDQHEECPRCGEALAAAFYDRHVSLGDCLPRPDPQSGSRCPLCHEDIPPRSKGWKQHLLVDTCPENPRSKDE